MKELAAESLVLKIEYFKRTVLSIEGLSWTDFLVICTLAQVQEQKIFVTPYDIIIRLNMNRGWIYRSIRKLDSKQFIHVHRREQVACVLSLSGFSKVLLNKAEQTLN